LRLAGILVIELLHGDAERLAPGDARDFGVLLLLRKAEPNDDQNELSCFLR
jgi:hypothetical protein